MDSLIQDLFAEGSQATPGRFSLDLRAKVEKLAKYQSTEPALYLLKAVQLAVGLRAESVDIRLARTSVEVRFRPKHSLLLSQTLSEDNDLTVMLLAALATQPKDLRLEIGGQVWSNKPTKTCQAPSQDFLLHLSKQSLSFWQRFLTPQQSASIEKSLVERCALCPIPVKLDGRVINSGRPELLGPIAWDLSSNPPGPKWAAELLRLTTEGDYFGLAAFGWRPTGHFQLNGDRYPLRGFFNGQRNSRVALIDDGNDRVSISEQEGRGWVVSQASAPDGQLRLEGWLGVRESPSLEISLIYIKRGVALDPVRVRGPWPGAFCVLAREHISTDLSQLNPVRNEEDLQKATRDLEEILRRLKVTRTSHFSVIDQTQGCYSPVAERLWDRDYALPDNFSDALYPLGRACTLFNLLNQFDETVTLWIDKHDRELKVLYGSQSETSAQVLAEFSQLTWVEVFHQQETPRHQLLLRSGQKWLRFSSDSRQLDPQQLDSYALRLARRSRCHIKLHPSQETSPCALSHEPQADPTPDRPGPSE